MANPLSASVTIFDLATTLTLSTSAVFESSFTSAGVATTVQVSLSQMGSTILTTFLNGTTGWPVVANGTTSAPSVQQLNLATTGVTGTLPMTRGGFGTTTLTAFGLLYGNGTSTVGVTAAGATGIPLVSNGTSVAPGFSLLTVVGGGLGTGTTTPYAVLCGGTTATSLVQSLATTAASGLVLTSNGSAALPAFQAPAYPRFPGGRLTLASATPVMTGSQAAQGTVYYTPAVHDLVPLYDGTNFILTTFTELSQATTDATKSPAAVAASKNYDMFAWSDSGTIRCTRGPAWSSDTARGTGAGTTELVFLKGLWLNTVSITNGPAASRGTYVGTIRSNGSSLIDYIFGAPASGGTAASFGVWNANNRVFVVSRVTDSGAAYTLTSATIRQARGTSGTGNQASFVRGLAEDGVVASIGAQVSTLPVATGYGQAGLGLDSTTTYDPMPALVYNPSAFGGAGVLTPTGHYNPGIGWHTISRNEAGDGANANNFNPGSKDYLGIELWQ